MTIASLAIGALGGGIKQVLCDVGKLISECVERDRFVEATIVEMQKTVLMDCESIIRKVLTRELYHMKIKL